MIGFGIGELFTLVTTLKTACDIVDEGPVGPLVSMAATTALGPVGTAIDAAGIAHDVFGVGSSGSDSTLTMESSDPDMYSSCDFSSRPSSGNGFSAGGRGSFSAGGRGGFRTGGRG
jgi:hypothetical protein